MYLINDFFELWLSVDTSNVDVDGKHNILKYRCLTKNTTVFMYKKFFVLT